LTEEAEESQEQARPLDAPIGAPERALVLVPVLRTRQKGAAGARAPEARVEEAVGLARAIDLDVVDAIKGPLAD
jgi:GTP-binding protein HflX